MSWRGFLGDGKRFRLIEESRGLRGSFFSLRGDSGVLGL
jgi:hypothetical protein